MAGVAPDLDGLGIILDATKGSFTSGEFYYYPKYHHWLSHGLPAAIVVSALVAIFGRRHWRVFLLAMLTFHLHLLCDFLGSRGPEMKDVWPIYYFGPLNILPVWSWKYQWRLDGWQNLAITLGLFLWCLWLAMNTGESIVALFSKRADRTFVAVLRKWFSPRSKRGKIL